MYERVVAWLLSFMGSRATHWAATSRYSVGTTAVQVLLRNSARYGCTVTNGGSGTVYVASDPQDLPANGHLLLSGNSLSLVGAEPLYAVSDASGPYQVSVIQEISR